MLTIKALIRWEQLRGKSFNSFQTADAEDATALLYVYALAQGHFCTLDEFRMVVDANSQAVEQLSKRLTREQAVASQFTTDTPQGVDGEQAQGEAMTLQQVAAHLIAAGLSPRYVLEEMELCDLPALMQAIKDKRKEELQSQRLWTFFSMLPHVGKGALKTPQDLFTFPWEVGQEHREADAKKEEEKFNFFMTTKREDYGG